MMRYAWGVPATILLGVFVSQTVSAQRREGSMDSAVFHVQLPVAVRFGEIVLPARHYRVTLAADGLALADPNTMILVATVPVETRASNEVVDKPSVEVKRSGNDVEILIRYADRVVRAAGKSAEQKTAAASSRVILAGKEETVVAGDTPPEQSEEALVGQAVARYLSGVKDCADKAQRNHWTTDDPRFVKCVCPLVSKWRLPKVAAPRRMHQILAKGRAGFSFTATAEGKAINCRVWVGPTPPVDPPPGAPEKAGTSAEGGVIPAGGAGTPTPLDPEHP